MSKWLCTLIVFMLSSSAFSIGIEIERVIESIKRSQMGSTDLKRWSTQYSSEKICHKLEHLNFEELVYFETIIPELNCKGIIWQQLVKFQQNQIAEFHRAYREKSDQLLRLRPAPVIVDNPHYGSINTEQGPVLVRADLPAGVVALTFDDGPHPSITPKIFEHLERSGSKATFFPTGTNALRFPNLITEYVRLGHTYGSHTMTHPDLRRISFTNAQVEILQALNVLTNISGQEIRFFRFPYGATNSQLNQFVKEQRIASFFWNIDSEDWRHRDPIKAYNQVVQQLNEKRSGIILFHDIVSATQATVEILINELHDKGYQIVLLRPQQ